MAQDKQNYFTAGVGSTSETVHIYCQAGVAVIMEQVGHPQYEQQLDWGRVAKAWWHQGIEKYSWDIDPAPIELGDDTLFGPPRYNVFLRKNGAHSKE